MLLTDASRKHLYPHLPPGLRIVELGVLRGANARHIVVSCAPSKMVLVDAWAATRREQHSHLSDAEFDELLRVCRPYYGGDITEQATHERILDECRRNMDLKGADVVFCRMSTHEFLHGGDGLAHAPFDVAYIDAGHQYEAVLSELKGILPLLAPGALIWLNDASLNARAFDQRMGVLQAAMTAIKLFGLVPLLINNDLNADLLLWRPVDDPQCAGLRFLSGLEQADHDFFEVPADLLGAYTQRIPFGFDKRVVSSLCAVRSWPIEARVLHDVVQRERTARSPQGRRNVPGAKLALARWMAATRGLLRSLLR